MWIPCDSCGMSSSGAMPTTSLDPSSGSRFHHRWVVILVAGIVLAAGISLAAHRWTHPTVFVDGDAGSFSTAAQPLSEFPLYVGFGYAPSGRTAETIAVDSVAVRFSKNSAAFTATVLVCTQRPVDEGTLVLGTAFAADDDLKEYCTELGALEQEASMRLERGTGQYFIAVLTPSRAGSAHIDAIDIRYSRSGRHFFQRGTQRVAQDMTITAKG